MANVLFVRGVETPGVRWWHTENSWGSNSYLEHPAMKEAIRINYPYFPSYLHRFIHVFFRERGWQEVETGTWSRGAPS